VAPSALSALTTSASLVPAGMLTSEPACAAIAMSVLSVTTVWPPEFGAGWLTCGLELIVTDRLPCATAHGASVTAWFITMEPVRAFITILAAGAVRAMSRFSRSARKSTRALESVGALTLMTRPSSARAVPAPLLALIALATARAVA